MGIQGLLPLLKSIQKPTHLRNFAGQTLGIDAYGWLHRGTISCAVELAEGRPTRKHIDFALNKVRMLIHFGVKPYMVFDGDYLPSKTHTEKGRAAKRRDSKKLGLELLRMGRTSQAQLELQKAIDVTPTMARELIEELKIMGVKYVVAPYEADSQLAYLEKQGIISGVLSEDSDLLVFGVQCLLTKLDQYGECIMVNRDHFTACKEISLTGWSDKEFRLMAMLSGCDYLPGIGGMGLKTAYRLVRKYKTVDRIIRTVQFDGKMKVPPGYLDAFLNAERTFLYQWVFCPETIRLRNLVELPATLNIEDMPFLGKHVEPEIAAGVACGDLDPNSKKPIVLLNRFHPPARRASAFQTPNEKNGKPISEYFRANRIPLAELDVNSFTPSPSQQRLLETQGNVSWSASQIPAPRPSILDRFHRVQAPASAPQISRRTVSDPCITNRRASPKRQRLCSDAVAQEDLSQDRESDELSTSPFFGNQSTTQASPSLRKKPRGVKAEDFELWSDDSIAEAMATATSVPQAAQIDRVSSPRKRKKLHIFADSPPPDDSFKDNDTSQESIDSSLFDESQISKNALTPSTSFGSLASASQDSLSQGMIRSHDPPKLQNTALEARKTSASGISQSSPREPLRKSSSIDLLDKFTFRQDLKEEGLIANSSLAADDRLEKANLGPDATATGDGPERFSCTTSLAALSTSPEVKGSEDLLVPNSPETSSDDGGTKPKLHLSKFAFTA